MRWLWVLNRIGIFGANLEVVAFGPNLTHLDEQAPEDAAGTKERQPMDQVQVMVALTLVTFVVMAAMAAFVVRVFKRVDRDARERYFGDLSHIRIPDDPRELTSKRGSRKHKTKPPYRPW